MKRRTFHHEFTVDASREEVHRFHSTPRSLEEITPPLTIIQFHELPSRLHEGSRIDFTLWMGPLPVRWIALIEQQEEDGFVDRQLVGPFASWVHLHRFVHEESGGSRVVDHIEAELSCNLLENLIGRVMWRSLPLLFQYRKRRTRKLLAQ